MYLCILCFFVCPRPSLPPFPLFFSALHRIAATIHLHPSTLSLLFALGGIIKPQSIKTHKPLSHDKYSQYCCCCQPCRHNPALDPSSSSQPAALKRKGESVFSHPAQRLSSRLPARPRARLICHAMPNNAMTLSLPKTTKNPRAIKHVLRNRQLNQPAPSVPFRNTHSQYRPTPLSPRERLSKTPSSQPSAPSSP